MLTEDVEDGGGEIRVFAVFDELAQDAEAVVLALGQLRLRGGEVRGKAERSVQPRAHRQHPHKNARPERGLNAQI